MGYRTRLPNLKKYWGVRLVEVVPFGVQRGQNCFFVLNALTSRDIAFFNRVNIRSIAYLSGFKMSLSGVFNVLWLLYNYRFSGGHFCLFWPKIIFFALMPNAKAFCLLYMVINQKHFQ